MGLEAVNLGENCLDPEHDPRAKRVLARTGGLATKPQRKDCP
jgi:hypothetical protein